MADDAQIFTRQDWRTTLANIGPELEVEGRACDAQNRFAADNLERLQAVGCFALGVPEDLGGGGADPIELGAMLRAVGRFDGSTGLALSMHTHQVAVAAYRRRAQNAPVEGLLKAVAQDGKRIVSSGGSDWLNGSGRAEKVEGGFRIHSRKAFASGSPAGDILMTSSVYDDPAEGKTVLHFAVPMNAPEVSIQPTWDTMGMRGTGSDDVVIDGFFVPDDKISGKRPSGKWHPLFHIISMIAFPLIYSVYAGIADGMRQTALDLAKTRAADPILVGEMETAHLAMEIAHVRMLHLAAAAAPGPSTTNEVMALRTLVARFALDVAAKAMEIAGGSGFYRAKGLELRFRDLQAARYHPLTERDQSAFAGRMALGLDIDG